MRKAFIILTGIIFTLLTATCKQFTADIDDYLGYWAAETYITDSSIKAVVQNDVNSIASVPSAEDVPITFTLQNPKSFPLDLPPEADAEKNVIVFEHLPKAPVAGRDYTLTQSEDRQSLLLTYKASFLQAHEWGEQDLSSVLTLYATDGRQFKQRYTFKVKANTPPPKPSFTVVKTKGSPAYYVLCIMAPGMDKKVPGGLLHKDLARVEINETSYSFSVNEAQSAFTKPEGDVFITHSEVEKLTEPGTDDVPTGGWVLYYKTDVEVKEGAAKKDYTIRLADEKGLVSAAVNASTKPNRPAPVQISLVKGICTADVNSDNTGAAPHIIGVGEAEKPATLRLTCATADSTIYYTLTEIGAGSLASPLTASGAGSGVDIPLPIQPGKTEAEYTLTVRAEADGFETGAERTLYYKIIAQNTELFLSRIELSRAHLVYNDTDLTITATLKGSNFDLIASQSDPTVKVGIFKDNALVGSLQTATAAGSDYTVTLTAPHLSSSEATVEGAVYTVKVKLCGTYQSATETFIISKEARLTAQPELSVTQIALSEVTSSTTTKITIKGINLDIAGGITVQLYDSNGAAYGSAAPIDTSNTGRELTTLTADIPVPSDEGVFTAKVLFGGVIQTSYYEGSSYDYQRNITHPAIQVYGSPKFTSFTIPNAGISKEDAAVTAAVKGANFKVPGVTASDFSVSCATASITDSSIITIIDDATLKVSLTIPGTANDYTVTVTCGSASIAGTFSVKDYSEYTVGKIVLADNTLVAKDDYTAIDESNPPVAVLIGTQNIYGAALGIALHISPSNLMWAKSGSTGHNTKFEGIICTAQGNNASTATFIGDIDGSDNWDYICSIDPEGTKAAVVAENYPAFHWVNRYNEEYAGKLGGTNFAWYMPSLAELCGVYKNREAINASLAKIHGHGNSYADSSLGTSWFWSSSQYSSYDFYAWLVNFDNGYVYSYLKNDKARVCCLAGL